MLITKKLGLFPICRSRTKFLALHSLKYQGWVSRLSISWTLKVYGRLHFEEMYKLFVLKYTSGGLIAAERQCGSVDSDVCVLAALNGCLMNNSVDSSPVFYSVCLDFKSSFCFFHLGSECCIIVQMLWWRTVVHVLWCTIKCYCLFKGVKYCYKETEEFQAGGRATWWLCRWGSEMSQAEVLPE